MVLEFNVRRSNLGISRGDPRDRVWLARRIFGFGLQDRVANLSTSFEIQNQCAKPGFAEIEEPRVVAVLLGHIPPSTNNSQYLPKLTDTQETYGLAAECEKVRHHAGGVIHLREARFKNLESLPIIALEHLNVRINHLVKWRRF